MWHELPDSNKAEYKRMILAFASLTEMFAQKATDDMPAPIINSKYQETVFQKVFGATSEDKGNTSFDASLEQADEDGKKSRFLVGIKTFGIASGAQKIAQFKAHSADWSSLISKMEKNAQARKGIALSKNDISSRNKALYKQLARKIASLRNMRIDSAIANLQGFRISDCDEDIEMVYHVLMPSKKGEPPHIYVGETDYSKIDIDNISVTGCTTEKNPTNFDFTDGRHSYRYTSADSQLLMNFQNSDIVVEKWQMQYAADAYSIFSEIADKIHKEKITSAYESYSWKINVEPYSGFNNFYGVGSKIGINERPKRIEKIRLKYSDCVKKQTLDTIIKYLSDFLTDKATTDAQKQDKAHLRNKILALIKCTENTELEKDVSKLLFRPKSEIYIPIPNSAQFHAEHPDFFAPNAGKMNAKNKPILDKERRRFTLVFEPSGDAIESYITQDSGKAIESCEKQSYLGEWILRKVFQLGEYEPLTYERLEEIGINGIRLSRFRDDTSVHLQFIWIDDDDLPSDYIK